MKRRRETEKEIIRCSSELRSAIEELSLLPLMKQHHHPIDEEHEDDDTTHHHQMMIIHIRPFLSLCNFLIHLLDKIGPTMVVLRQDVHRNIQRLEKMHELEPTLYSNIVEILKKEAKEGTSKKLTSCSKAFVWLTRSLDFTTNLLKVIEKDTAVDMEKAVKEAYEATLKPWHGWISSTAYRVALKLIPDNKTVTDILKSEEVDQQILKDEIKTLVSLLAPLLDEIHSILESYGLDRVKAT